MCTIVKYGVAADTIQDIIKDDRQDADLSLEAVWPVNHIVCKDMQLWSMQHCFCQPFQNPCQLDLVHQCFNTTA